MRFDYFRKEKVIMEYNFKSIEQKWQKYWEDNNSFKAENNSENCMKQKPRLRRTTTKKKLMNQMKIRRKIYSANIPYRNTQTFPG